MNRHAYLIMAHNQFNLLKKIISLLDFEGHDFYIHIDKKSVDFNLSDFEGAAKKSNIIFIDRRDTVWGGYSGIETELALLEKAAKGDYSYFHLISGADMPLKPAKEIYEFFEQSGGKEFVHFCTEEFNLRPSTAERASLYHPFHEKAGRQNNFYKKADDLLLALQRRLGVNRFKKAGIVPFCGANWFSITDGFAKYLLSKKDFIKKYFSKSFCADELFLQTVLMASDFKNNLYRPCFSDECISNMRYVDWKRGNPYVFKSGDFDELMSCGCMFARKFDIKADEKICEKIYTAIKND